MSLRSKISVVAFVLLVTSIPAVASFAAPATNKSTAAQTGPACKDVNFLTEVSKDFTDLGPAFKGIDPKAPESTSAVILQIATVRQKYEDMTVASECLPAQIQVIVTLANGGDLASLVLAAQVDKKTDPKVYTDAIDRQSKRFASSASALTNIITGGAATPAATPAS
jgi:hypothetical protein